MRKHFLLFVFIQILAVASAQDSITVNVKTPGGLSSAITAAGGDLNTINNLTITGTIDARDFKTMRDEIAGLSIVDLRNASITAYSGTGGTSWSENLDYLANAIPLYAFTNKTSSEDRTTITSIIIPSSVTSIGAYAFYRCGSLKSVTIPNSVTNIGYNAFQECKGLSMITLPNSLTTIENMAFLDCKGLSKITIPNSVTSISNAFMGCNITFTFDAKKSNFSSVDGILFNKDQTTLVKCPISKKGRYTIPNSVTSIDGSAFYGCNGLTTIVIPNTVTSIGAFAFDSCSSLSSITIPHSVISIGFAAFANCENLSEVAIPNSLSSIRNFVFSGCSSLKSVIIPNSITSIDELAFSKCSSLKSVTIPSSVTSIDSSAFSGCSNLTSITFNSITPLVIADAFFEVNKTTCKLYVPLGSKSLYQAAQNWKDFENIVEVNLK